MPTTTTTVTVTIELRESIADLAERLFVAGPDQCQAVKDAIAQEFQSLMDYDGEALNGQVATVDLVETTEPDPVDYEVTSGGLNLVLIRPVSRAAHQWLADHVGAVETFAGRIAVEPRYLQALLERLNEDGLRGVER